MDPPQVFISSRRSDMRTGFLGFLVTALRNAKIKVFTDRDEYMGAKLENLLVRIEESRIAIAIFSMNYSSSEMCLNQLVKIKECMDQRGLIAIPIFYKIEPSMVKRLEGHFGDAFRALKRRFLHEPLRTQKWEEALTSIPQIIGKHLPGKSDLGDEDFITLIVEGIQKTLSNISMEENPLREVEDEGEKRKQSREANDKVGSMVTATARQPEITHSESPQKSNRSFKFEEPKASLGDVLILILHGVVKGFQSIPIETNAVRRGSVVPGKELSITTYKRPNDEAIEISVLDDVYRLRSITANYEKISKTSSEVDMIVVKSQIVKSTNAKNFVINARELYIEWSENPDHWIWLPLPRQIPNEPVVEAAHLKKVSWLYVAGNFDTRYLCPGKRYEVVFMVKLEDTGFEWSTPVFLELVMSSRSSRQTQKRSVNTAEHISNQWIDLPVGEFTTSLENAGLVTFTMLEDQCQLWKSGLFVKGVAIRPKH